MQQQKYENFEHSTTFASNKITIQDRATTADALLFFAENIKQVQHAKDITIDVFLDNIQNGFWQDFVIPVWAAKDKMERRTLKEKAPYVCVSGTGAHRSEAGINQHSGFIAIDIDDIDIAKTKKILRNDQYVFSCFNSISNTGLCAIIKINGEKHAESFLGLQAYFFEKYQILIDESCKDVSRPRYVSFDPSLYRNDHSKIFKEYPKKETAALRKERCKGAVAVRRDFENITLREIEEKRENIVPNYVTWRNVGFALANQWGEYGRLYFHRISVFGDYDPRKCDKQYDACLKADSEAKKGKKIATINYLFELCKTAGISTESEITRFAKEVAYMNKRAGISVESSIKNINEENLSGAGLTHDIVIEIVNQVFEKDVFIEGVTIQSCAKLYIKEHYDLKINSLTNKHENAGKEVSNYDMHGIELDLREQFPELDYATISKLLDSKAVPKYNPILDFIERNKDRGQSGSIDNLFSCIETETGVGIRDDYAIYFGKKWLVGMIACLYEDVSPLMLILCGTKQGTGKTFFFENLLPKELKKYCTIKNLSSLSSDTFKRDMDIAISRYWLIYDDEMSGKSRRDEGIIKALLSTHETNVRAAFAKHEENRKRIASFGGTTNDLQILGDHTGNRRFIPIEVLSIDQERKDRIDPVEYIIEAYHLYRSGFNYKILGSDMRLLNECTGKFNKVSTEFEMVQLYYEAPVSKHDNTGVYRTATDIKNKLEMNSREKMNYNKLSAALKNIGIEGVREKRNGIVSTWYFVSERNTFSQPHESAPRILNTPF
ncbi:MAG: PriCT-2 domain-containing protein [Bacteroidetes bacterium]|nr:PriCT-2 domain-containing protein [Bacteroidota bacterium]